MDYLQEIHDGILQCINHRYPKIKQFFDIEVDLVSVVDDELEVIEVYVAFHHLTDSVMYAVSEAVTYIDEDDIPAIVEHFMTYRVADIAMILPLV